jgi:hypothetical protein
MVFLGQKKQGLNEGKTAITRPKSRRPYRGLYRIQLRRLCGALRLGKPLVHPLLYLFYYRQLSIDWYLIDFQEL